MFLSRKQIYPIGLDISDLSIKAVQLNKNGDKIRIQAISKVNLPKGIISNGDILNKEEVIKSFNQMVNSPLFGKFTQTEVVACLPESKTFVKQIEVNGTEINESLITGEIEKNIPLAIDELNYDWQLTEPYHGTNYCLIGAAPKNIVEQYRSLFEDLNLFIVALEIAPISICRSLLPEENIKYKGERNKNYMILDIGAKRTSLTIYSKDTIITSISIPISGEFITDTISKQLEISPEQAEKAKIICGLDDFKAQGVIKALLSDMISTLIDRIKEAIEYYNDHYSDRGPINKILLCGGGANIKNLNSILSQNLLIETVQGDPLANLNEKSDDFVNIFKEIHDLSDGAKSKNNKNPAITGSIEQKNELTFTTAIGLSLRDIFIS